MSCSAQKRLQHLRSQFGCCDVSQFLQNATIIKYAFITALIKLDPLLPSLFFSVVGLVSKHERVLDCSFFLSLNFSSGEKILDLLRDDMAKEFPSDVDYFYKCLIRKVNKAICPHLGDYVAL